MQARPIRSQIYLPVLRFGITDEDWGLVIAASLLGYAVPFLLGWKYKQLPLELVGWLVVMGAAIFSLNLLRRQQHPHVLQHTLQAALRGKTARRRLPGAPVDDWLKADDRQQQ